MPEFLKFGNGEVSATVRLSAKEFTKFENAVQKLGITFRSPSR